MPNATILHWGQTSVAQFLKAHWQQKPLVLRGLVSPESVNTSLAELMDAALGDAIDCRLIRNQDRRWTMKQGPFDRLPALRQKGWTVLLQGMDRHLEQAYRLRMAFSFVPHSRIDDVMISVASNGGGVGPHLDEYDVFLVQGLGRRLWRWGHQRDQSFQADKPLKLLQRFEPQEEAILEPGDALYLPPRWANEGVALGPCSTWSVGFRAPSRHEFLEYFLLECSESLTGKNPRFQDPGARATRKAGRIPPALAEQLQQWACGFRADKPAVMRALGRFLSEPAGNAWFEAPQMRLRPDQWLDHARRRGIALHPASRMVYDRKSVWINGEPAGPPEPLLCTLADRRSLSASELEDYIKGADRSGVSTAPIHAPSGLNQSLIASECKKTVETKPLLERLLMWYYNGWIGFFG